MKPVVVHVVCVPLATAPGELTRIGLLDESRRSFYYQSEAASAAVTLALNDVCRQVGQGSIPAADGFTVHIRFVDDQGLPIAGRFAKAPEADPSEISTGEMPPIDAAYEALQGRLGGDGAATERAAAVLAACEEYSRAEDALPGDEFDEEGFYLSAAIEVLVSQRNYARAMLDQLAHVFGLHGQQRTADHVLACAIRDRAVLRRDPGKCP